ncbi:Dipeptidyl-peptidase 6 [Sulfitobacter sp. THAF37]|uniref:C40 family peptidase n=1 Tax=Sulfitobacter sp. THAF37 TaxID=2587855 RepID=UPI001268768D|nr:NlpC/P60 family protein [Sulfitobacter sp. THAF37]QFT58467.1 Dipeptidyl-peptidase 6 [Sulfitobacter sp. THAF37]
MSDPRLTPIPALTTRSEPARITVPVADLCRSPGGPRDRQLLFGDSLTQLGPDTGGYTYVQAEKDGYCGHIRTDALGKAQVGTHWVIAPATHIYSDATFKSPEICSLSFGSRVTVTGTTENYAVTPEGFIPLKHLREKTQHFDDPAAVAALFLGTPYLWGGNSRWGIDCSGLVQAALLACGVPCPGDSDQQLILGDVAKPPYRRNDLLFWKGHVALVSDPETLIHANAHTMLTVHEPISEAILRIGKQGDGPVTAHRRLVPDAG